MDLDNSIHYKLNGLFLLIDRNKDILPKDGFVFTYDEVIFNIEPISQFSFSLKCDNGKMFFSLEKGLEIKFDNTISGYVNYLLELIVEAKNSFELYSEHNKRIRANPYQIYKITNKKNGLCYIGKSIELSVKRWKDHITSSESKISKAIKEEGIENFIFEVIEIVGLPPTVCSQKEANDYVFSRERSYIQQFDSINNGYNRK